MSDKISSKEASERFISAIRENYLDDTRPAEVRHVAEVYINLISVLDILFALGQTIEMLPLTPEQRSLFGRSMDPLNALMDGIGDGVVNLAPQVGDADV